MAGRVPAIHDFTGRAKDVDGRHEGGHDEMRQPGGIASSIPGAQPDSPGPGPGMTFKAPGDDVEGIRDDRETSGNDIGMRLS